MSSNWSLSISLWAFLAIFAFMICVGCCSVFPGITPLQLFDPTWWGKLPCCDCWGCCNLPCGQYGYPRDKTKLVPLKQTPKRDDNKGTTTAPQVVVVNASGDAAAGAGRLRPREAVPAAEEEEEAEQFPLLVLSRKSSTGFRETFYGVDYV